MDSYPFLWKVKEWLWGAPLLLLLFGTGVYLTFILRGVQFRYLDYALKQAVAKRQEGASGDIGHFEALMTTLAGAIGTGAIVGVASAVAVGGPGALFWMWVAAVAGMAIKYAESLLAVKYREKDSRGEMIGGPMEYMERGLGWKGLAALFALFGSFAAIGTGNLVQVNSIIEAAGTVWQLEPWQAGLGVAVPTGLVVVGGVRSIGRVAGVMVPLMALFYLAGGFLILALNVREIPEALLLLVKEAFCGRAAAGGLMGAGVMTAIQMGVSRSVFSNEAGMGISSIAAAAAITDSPARQGLITMTGALISTGIVCTVTGLAIAVTGVLNGGTPLNGAPLAIEAFRTTIPGGEYVVIFGLILFAFSTIIAWAYYGEKCFEYLFGERAVLPYRFLFTLAVIPGALLRMETVWVLADIANALMVAPNLIALIFLAPVVAEETRKFLTTTEGGIAQCSQ